MTQQGRGRAQNIVCATIRPTHLTPARIAFLALLLVLLLQAASAQAATYTFSPVADSYTRSDSAATNYGTASRVSARTSSYQTRHAYLRFNVALLPGETVTSATLNVYASTSSTNIDLRDVASNSWSETTLTWNSAPTFSSSVISRVASVSKGTTATFGATPLVSGSGLVSMALTSASSTTANFHSRQASTNRPRLVVQTSPAIPIPGDPPPADTAAPETSITSAPASPTTSTSASFSFGGADNTTPATSLAFECSSDGSGYTPCSPIKSYSPVATGTHSFAVRAIDGAGNVDPTPAVDSWDVTTAAPPPPPPATGSAWSWDARSATLDPNNAAMVTAFQSYAVKTPNMALSDWAVATAEAGAGDPEYSIPRSDQGGSITVRIPLGAMPDPSGDGHLTVRDVERGIETDFWQAVYNPTTQRISSTSAAVSFPIGSVNERTTGWGGNAANTPLLRGLVTPEAINAGVINETLQFSTPQIGTGSPRFPAMHNAPTCGTTCVNHLVEGTWVRLDPAYDVNASTLPAWQKTIARALQDHGAILRDNGGTLSVYGRNPINGGASWASAGFSGTSAGFSSAFPWNRIQILNPPSP